MAQEPPSSLLPPPTAPFPSLARAPQVKTLRLLEHREVTTLMPSTFLVLAMEVTLEAFADSDLELLE